MNIEIANRLVNLRKGNNLSQEALAEKLGISRQAVSKWERAEASPDTDNLILLARLYGVSLDELLQTEEEVLAAQQENTSDGAASDQSEEANAEDMENDGPEEYVHVGARGIHVKDKDGSEVHVGWNGIHVEDKKGSGDNVHIDNKGVYVNGEKYDYDWHDGIHHFPIGILVTVAYLLIGVLFNAWHPGWMLFLLIPVGTTLMDAIRSRNANRFAYPVLATLIFLYLGFFYYAWHPGWVVFVTIPLYYSFVSYFRGFGRHRRRAKAEAADNLNFHETDTDRKSGEEGNRYEE